MRTAASLARRTGSNRLGSLQKKWSTTHLQLIRDGRLTIFARATQDMFDALSNLMGRRPPQKGAPMMPEPRSSPSSFGRSTGGGQTFSKVFRWRLPDGVTEEPRTVEVVGSCTHWQRIPLQRDGKLDAWHVTVHHIPGNRTHHYMLLVDGKPTYDKNCDGLAVPHGMQEEQYAFPTDRGPRVFMLFAQTR